MVWAIAFLPEESPRAGVVSVGPLVIDAAIVFTVSLAWAWAPVDERAQGVGPSVVSPARWTPTPSLGEEGVETTDGLAGVAAGRRKTSRAIVRGETTLKVRSEFSLFTPGFFLTTYLSVATGSLSIIQTKNPWIFSNSDGSFRRQFDFFSKFYQILNILEIFDILWIQVKMKWSNINSS